MPGHHAFKSKAQLPVAPIFCEPAPPPLGARQGSRDAGRSEGPLSQTPGPQGRSDRTEPAMTTENRPDYCSYLVPTGHIDGGMRRCCRSATDSLGTIPVCSQHLGKLLAEAERRIDRRATSAA